MTAPRRHYGTPVRSVRVPDDLWERARRKAATRTFRGKPAPETLTDVINRALERYARVEPVTADPPAEQVSA